jgi:hypothetical protein
MVSFTWNPGDGSPNETFFSGINTFTHAYAAGTQQAVVWVTGDDERGGRFFEARELDVTNCKFPRRDAQRRECGCDSMVVSATAGRTSQIYCMVDAPDDKPGCSLAVNAPVGACTGYLEKPYECSLGPKDARIPIPSTQGGEYRFLGWSFDVNASFSRSTLTPAECSQGQFLRQTVEGQLAGSPPTITRAIPASPVPAFGEYPMPLSNGASVTVVTSYPIPVFNAPNQGRKVSYGANGHVLEDRFTRPMDWAQGPSGTGFRQWFDQAAAYLPLNQAQIQNSSFAFLRHQAEFITFVAGSHGTCWCQFRIEQELTPSGRQAIGGGPPPMALKLIGGRNCTLQ